MTDLTPASSRTSSPFSDETWDSDLDGYVPRPVFASQTSALRQLRITGKCTLTRAGDLSSTPILDLPPELLENILELVHEADPKTILAVRRTSKELNALTFKLFAGDYGQDYLSIHVLDSEGFKKCCAALTCPDLLCYIGCIDLTLEAGIHGPPCCHQSVPKDCSLCLAYSRRSNGWGQHLPSLPMIDGPHADIVVPYAHDLFANVDLESFEQFLDCLSLNYYGWVSLTLALHSNRSILERGDDQWSGVVRDYMVRFAASGLHLDSLTLDSTACFAIRDIVAEEPDLVDPCLSSATLLQYVCLGGTISPETYRDIWDSLESLLANMDGLKWLICHADYATSYPDTTLQAKALLSNGLANLYCLSLDRVHLSQVDLLQVLDRCSTTLRWLSLSSVCLFAEMDGWADVFSYMREHLSALELLEVSNPYLARNGILSYAECEALNMFVPHGKFDRSRTMTMLEALGQRDDWDFEWVDLFDSQHPMKQTGNSWQL